MIQCKIFSGTDAAAVEHEVNNFLRDCSGASIHTILQSATGDRLVVSIFYNRRTKREKLKEATAVSEMAVNLVQGDVRSN